ncbi:peptidoglycan D,D-transpeptidase FtsI family protein [Saccharothrix coeruleofusca]|uniref:Penicillin-binding protein A n=1 Tax=Saccharothrix coeruleofusca TaxID=33919 RepID=A0A918ECA1_9PSEU|nr:penicillin-binding protein 2 [Saccharothrix coeruleofusca]MBP2339984.1 peptidoglycan glycosyltransferase [Saccharothrix coeruleofusca]GGP38155.1 penicillin-binding protein A [Saccharothrix coeruleofusca]
MNKPLRRIGIAMMAMILLLMGNATYVQVIKADDYRKNPHNSRVLLDTYSRERGSIIASDGSPLAGVQATDDRLKFLRTYANGPVYAPVTGYFSLLYGATGIERAEDDLLNGSDDRLITQRVSDLITGRDPKGGSVQVTIDPRVQQAAFNALSERGLTGSVVAIRPSTGEILAMASTPSFDPNQLASHDTDVQQETWAALNNDDGQPALNRSVAQIYPPGSTFKLVVAAAALEEGANKETQVDGRPVITLPGTQTTLPNFNDSNCGDGQKATLQEALAKSCNTAFAVLADQLGPDKLRAKAAQFGIGQEDLTIPLPVEPSTLGPMADRPSVYQSGIGQRDVRVTPLANAVMAATIANGGTRMQPHLVQKVLAPDLQVIDETDPEEVEEAMSPEQARMLREMMVASEGNTAGGGKLSGVTIASKTGTAEHGEDVGSTKPHAWYVAFAPAEKPEIAVAVIVENGGDVGQAATGGRVAAPIGRAVIGAALGGR